MSPLFFRALVKMVNLIKKGIFTKEFTKYQEENIPRHTKICYTMICKKILHTLL